jgi:hypothetical protein
VSQPTEERPAHHRRKRREPRRRLPSGFSTLRDLLSFVVGMVIIGNEVFFSETVEPYAVGVGVALTGLPLVFGAQDRRTGDKDPS